MMIRTLKESDAQLYQELRLTGLKVNPEAFGSTFESEVNLSLESVAERLKPTKEKFVLGAFDDRQSLIGVVTFIRNNSLKTIHKGNVFGMYVSLEYRGQGLGKSLMIELIKRAKVYDGLEQINLAVVSENVAAKKLYKSVGFEVYGVERNALKFNNQYFDEDLMVLFI